MGGMNWMPETTSAAAWLIFLATYAVMAVGKIPVYRIDRAGAALLGGSLMVATGVLSLEEAYRAVDFNTIVLLLGMMIVVANLRLSGFFRVITYWTAAYVRRPITLLGTVIFSSGILSAFLVNDTICLVMTPLVLELVTRLKRNPIPYLLAVATASNIGSVATITGNPQNIIIGSLSGIPYGDFAAALVPVAVIGLMVTSVLIALSYRSEFFTPDRFDKIDISARYHGPLLAKSLVVMAVMVVLFFFGQPVAKVAIMGGAFLLLTRRVRPEKVYIEIDWPLLVMFVGLFVVIGGLEKAVITADVSAAIARQHLDNPTILASLTAVLSNLVSNVPAVLLLKSFVPNLQDPQRAWLVVAMAATLAGNFTLVGSVANLIVAQRAKARGVELNFGEYFKLGAPLTVLTIAFGLLWL
ncbi:Na+/H+ antiporter NhaD/arsenite permease-like protein [Bradyrhizobium sp. AZCC 1610]|uniref:SLC13 family permease n=1 Tax=Bradyrhizobium sp. AZCC 1610 TaxID=3117020 RepID=UPI002FF12EEF